MSNRLKHSLLAYAILVLTIYCCWQFVFSHLMSQLQQLKSSNQLISTKLAETTDQNSGTSKAVKQLVLEDHNQASTKLESLVKQAVINANGEINQLLPNSNFLSKSLQRQTFDISFSLQPLELAAFCNHLAEGDSSISLESINLRHNQNVQPTLLEANASFTLISGKLPESTGFVLSRQDFSPNQNLNGLFSQAYRKKLQNPGIHHYQLTAAIVSSTTKVAIILDSSTNTTKRYKLNDRLDGWTITEIRPKQIKLTKGELEESLKLKQNTN